MLTKSTKAKVLALVAIGICDALQQKKITTSEAEQLLFSPFVMDAASHWDSRVIEFIHMGTELDNLLSIVPKEYDPTIDQIRELALEYLSLAPKPSSSEEHWVKQLA